MAEREGELAREVDERVLAGGGFARVGGSAGEQRLWADCDLASLAENRLPLRGRPDPRRFDPRCFDERTRADLLRRAVGGDERLRLPAEDDFRDAYWLVGGGERVGTFAVERLLFTRHLLPIWSLYVFPEHRRRGHGRRAVARAHRAALACGLRGLRVATEWSWQGAVRFYLTLGCWVPSWKRSLVFSTDADLPERRIEETAARARLAVRSEAGWTPLIDAENRGERLGWHEHGDPASHLLFAARSLLAVALAVRGWPLIRSDVAWQDQLELGFSDIGGPEGLAFKIRRFEALDRERGWRVETPAIPGVAG